MSLEALGQVVAKAAPLLGNALGGSAGAAIGSIIAAKWGGNIDSAEELIQRIESDPQAHLKLIEIQSNHEIELQRIQLMEAEMQLKERENARQRETTLAQAGKRDITPALLAYLLTFGILGALYYLFTHHVPTENKELIIAIVSAFSTVWIGAMAYFHGSSAGSRAKDTPIRHLGIPYEEEKRSTIEML